jgi:8-oxo-dGTP pyrophosphatase MutT (NUDIX family)
MIDVVAAVIVRNGRLLLTQRAPEQHHPWLWHCPGGKCEGPTEPGCAGESWEDAAIRETREELGLDGPIVVPRDAQGNVEPIAQFAFELGLGGSAAIWMSDSSFRSQPRSIMIAWYAVDIGDQKPLPIEGVGVGWFDERSLLMLQRHCSNSIATLTEPTHRALPALLAHMRRRMSCGPK